VHVALAALIELKVPRFAAVLAFSSFILPETLLVEPLALGMHVR